MLTFFLNTYFFCEIVLISNMIYLEADYLAKFLETLLNNGVGLFILCLGILLIVFSAFENFGNSKIHNTRSKIILFLGIVFIIFGFCSQLGYCDYRQTKEAGIYLNKDLKAGKVISNLDVEIIPLKSQTNKKEGHLYELYEVEGFELYKKSQPDAIFKKGTKLKKANVGICCD